MIPYSFISKWPLGWRCSYCLEENPNIRGRTVAHKGGGELHPIHLDCMLVWRIRSIQCPDCLCKTDANAVMTSAAKLKLVAARFLRDLTQTIRSPIFRLSAWAVCTVVGSRKKKPMLSALGWFFQWLNIHQIILYGGGHIEIAKKLEKLCSKLIVPFNEAQFKKLQTVALLHQRYYKILNDQEGEVQGVTRLLKTLKKELRGHQVMCLCRLVAAFNAFYFILQPVLREFRSRPFS